MSILLHIVNILGASLITTLFLMPISALDTYFIATFYKYSLFLTIPIILIMDAITAVLAYRLAYWLIPKVVKKEKTKEKLANIGLKLNKWGWLLLFIAAATPFPYTLTIYSAGVTKWGNNLKVASAIMVGKLARYVVVAVAMHFGYDLLFSK